MSDVTRVTPASFASFTSSADFALLCVDTSHSEIPTAVIEHLKAEYPGKFAFGTLRRDDAPLVVWWNKHFGQVIGTLTSTWSVPSGYYLFHLGKIACHHSGKKKRTSGETNISLGIHLAGLLFNAPNINKALTKSRESEDMNAFLSDIETIIAQIQRRAESTRRFSGTQGTSANVREPSPAKQTPPPPDPPKPEPAPKVDPSPKKRPSRKKEKELEDPYAILGIQGGASDEEIKKAYRQKIALNHPDKVAHLSEKLRKTADEETRRIMNAYESLAKRPKGL